MNQNEYNIFEKCRCSLQLFIKTKTQRTTFRTRHEDVDESEIRHEDNDDESEARLLDSESKVKRDNDDGPYGPK